MKQLVVSLLFLIPGISFADTTITGVVSQTGGMFQIEEDSTGQIFEVVMHFTGGSACGQARRFYQGITEAVGHETQMTGIFSQRSTGTPTFQANPGEITVLSN